MNNSFLCAVGSFKQKYIRIQEILKAQYLNSFPGLSPKLWKDREKEKPLETSLLSG